ncbi:helix-turn-helix transcriptional regulator [Pseudooceanicola sp. 502str34]|uniref:helix-turn-helix transcriptional regulator n=1 Tax=Maritimibacter alkaliphilus TaxID=404236 RepID=UPI001C9511EE|nr:LuxR family transcriptional regulator [Maritimibacter alkaliphilus]MBY6090800.1 LuxR family transcriptional regulator [Maritimibacter alkaliphilus]
MRYSSADRMEANCQTVEAVGGSDELQELLVRFRDDFGLQHLSYNWVTAPVRPCRFGTLPEAWLDYYKQRNYAMMDPVILGASRHFGVVNWADLDWSSRIARDMRAEANAHGVGWQGLSVPVRGPRGQFALLTATSDVSDEDWALFVRQQSNALLLLGHTIHRKVLALCDHSGPETTALLSPRECETMTLLAQGKSRAQVAQELSISEHTLRDHINSVRNKLKAGNTVQAVALAQAYGLIVVV